MCVLQGCVCADKGDLEAARALFVEAAHIEPYCVEALFNIGLVNLRMEDPEVRFSTKAWLGSMGPIVGAVLDEDNPLGREGGG